MATKRIPTENFRRPKPYRTGEGFQVTPIGDLVGGYNPLQVAWVVSAERKDKRTGVINPSGKSKYYDELLQNVTIKS